MKKPLPPPDWAGLLAGIAAEDPQRMIDLFASGRAVDEKGRYLHWDQMRHRQPPDGLTLNEWWVGTAASRATNARLLPFTGTNGNPFRFTNIDRVQQMVHRIDQQASGRIQTDEIVANVGSRNRYLVSSLVEEAISSSLLEGAATTRRVAKELLRTGREPRDTSERMIFNNYLAMRRAEEIAGSGEPWSPIMSWNCIGSSPTARSTTSPKRDGSSSPARIGSSWTGTESSSTARRLPRSFRVASPNSAPSPMERWGRDSCTLS